MSLGPLASTVKRTHAKRRDIDTRPKPSSAKSPRLAASSRTKPARSTPSCEGEAERRSRNISPSTTRHALVIGCSAPSERRLFRLRAYDLSPSKRTRHPVSKIDRHMDLTPSPSAEERRILMRAPGCGVEELVGTMRLGAEGPFGPHPVGVRPTNMPVASLLLDLWLGRSAL